MSEDTEGDRKARICGEGIEMNHQYEEREQMALMHWAAYYESEHPELALLFHIPNGGTRNKREAGRLKAAGVKAGVSSRSLLRAAGGK